MHAFAQVRRKLVGAHAFPVRGFGKRGPRRTRRTADRPSRLIGYCRVSTDEQAQEGVSMDAQRERLEAHCLAQSFRTFSHRFGPGIDPGQFAYELSLVTDRSMDDR